MRYDVHNGHGNEAPVAGSGGTTEPLWVRPSDWIAMPTLSPTEEKMVALFAVRPGATTACFEITDGVAVDWGDGSPVEEVVGGGKFLHVYDYSNTSLTSCSRGYKQALITVTPLTLAHIGAISIGYDYTNTSFIDNSAPDSGFLDISIAGPNLYNLRISRGLENTYIMDSPDGRSNHDLLERVRIISSSLNQADYLFCLCRNLRSVEVSNSPGIVSWYRTFYGCSSLVEAIGFDLSGTTTVGEMFSGCYSLKAIQSIDTSSVVNFTGMLRGCSSLIQAPSLNTGISNTLSGLFDGCRSLVSISSISLPFATSINSLFNNCYNLRESPPISMPEIHDVSSMYSGCRSLATIGTMSLPVSATMADAMFEGCKNLRSVANLSFAVSPSTPYFNGSTNITEVTTGSMFKDCVSLEKTGLTAHTGYLQNLMYANCPALRETGTIHIPTLWENRPEYIYWLVFDGDTNLSKINFRDVDDSLNLSSLNLPKSTLLDIASNMTTAATDSRKIILRNVYSVDAEVISAFNAKGRTVITT